MVFVVDAAGNLARLEEARDMLHAALVHEQLAATPLLLPQTRATYRLRGPPPASPPVHLTGEACEARAWHIGACSALTGRA